MASRPPASSSASPPLIQLETGPKPPRRVVALVGPPNSGKSTLFNRLTGLRQKTANYPGVTVEQHWGQLQLRRGEHHVPVPVDIVDLPGIYSLDPRSEDEQVTRDVLLGEMPGVSRPDAVLVILDSTNLARNLAFAAPILGLGLQTLVVLNMADELEKRGGQIDTAEIAAKLGAPVALVSAARGHGLDAVYDFLSGGISLPKPTAAPFELPVLNNVPQCRAWAARVSHGAYQAPAPPVWSKRLDALLLHPLWGPLVFIAVVLAVFQAMFTAAPPVMDLIEAGIGWAGDQLKAHAAPSLLRDLLIEGVLGGVGSVVVFLPQILFLFFFVGMLEDSGYLARAALIADRTMARVGLQGKSFIPLLSAYACAVPAIMATRTIESKRDRLATILIAPFMTCSARLPVYAVIIAAFIPERRVLGPFLGTQALALVSLYLIGFLAAVITAKALKSSVLKTGERTPFVMEMPPYRWPTWRGIGLRLWDRAKAFLVRAGTTILAVSVVLWVLAHVPPQNGQPPAIQDSLAGTMGRAIEPLIQPLGFNWKIGIGLLTSLAAREVIVGTLGTIYGIENADEASPGLQAALQKDLTLPGAAALLVFFAFAMQCLSTVAVVRRETGGWRLPAIQFAYMTALAYVAALGVNRLVAWLIA